MHKIQKALQTISSLFYYLKVVKKLKTAESPVFFIFPSFEIGGAERVHADIMETVKDIKPTCIITSIPANSLFKKDFTKVANVIELKRWGTKKSFKPKMIKLIAKTINKNNSTVFGCNSIFFYDLIPHLNKTIKIIDLTHAFTETSSGTEIYSLPFIERINTRVILGKKTLNDYQALYKENNIAENLLNRFKIIPNQLDSPNELIKKENTLPLSILFIGRNSKEKRPNIFFQIAKTCTEMNLPVSFTAIGNFDEYKEEFSSYVHFLGVIESKEEINTFYKKSHLILITSSAEGFPMVLLEGMAYGVVPISTHVGEIPFYISEQKHTGFLVNKNLASSEIVHSFVAIIKDCSLNPEKLSKYAEQGFLLIKRDFNTIKFKESYRSLLTKASAKF